MSSHCFIPGCKTGNGNTKKYNRRHGIKNAKLFSVPRDYELLRIWQKVIPRTDKIFSVKDKVCELHFSKDDLKTHFECLLPNGHLFQLERARSTLKPNAIPTTFPKLPEYSSCLKKIVSELQKKQSSMFLTLEDFKFHENLQMKKEISTANSETTCDENIKECTNSTADKTSIAVDNRDICDEDINICESDTNITDENTIIYTEVLSPIDKNADKKHLSEPEEITFNVLVKNLEAILKPNNLWSITEHGKFVMCAKWNKNYALEKRVVIDCNLNIKVYLKDKEVAAYNDTCLSDISDVSTILHLIDR